MSAEAGDTMTIEEIRSRCHDSTIEVTSHILLRFRQRGITYVEIKEALLTGEMIEDYPDSYPYPSCLVLGRSAAGRALHIVVGISETKLWLITAYEPDPSEWSPDFKRRRH